MSDQTAEAKPEIGVAIVGCGMIGTNHAAAISHVPGLRVVAVVDGVAEATARLAQSIADDTGIRPLEFADLDAGLAEPSVQLVAICTPSGLHVEQLALAVRAGRHVVIEKPLDVDLERARRAAALADEAGKRGLVVSVISQHRFDPASIAVNVAIEAGELGRLTSGVASIAWWRGQDYYDSAEWRGTWQLDGGGAAMNQGIHTIDLLLWFLGRPVSVYAHTALLAHDRIEVEDVAVATVTFASGALAVIHATTAAYPGLSTRVQIYGSTGSAAIQDDRLEYLHVGSGGDQAVRRVAASEVVGGPDDPGRFVHGHERQYADILDAIHTNRPAGVRVADALLAFAVVRALYISSTLGREVSIADVLTGDFDDVVVHTGGTE